MDTPNKNTNWLLDRLKERSTYIGIFLFIFIPLFMHKLWQVPRIQEAIIDLAVNTLKEPGLISSMSNIITSIVQGYAGYLILKKEHNDK